MGKLLLNKIPYPGFRNIKTAISIMICLIFYKFSDRQDVTLAAIASLICMQDSVEKSIKEGINRVIGTVIGGLFAIIFVYLNLTETNYILWSVSITIGIIILIYICNIINIKQSIIIGCVVYLVIILGAGTYQPVLYSINRVLDTIIGIIIAISVNYFLFRPKPERYNDKKKGAVLMDFNYELITQQEHKTSNWSGGTTTEIYIHPKNALYADRDFNFRISSASVNMDESNFSKLGGYMRHIMVLDGSMRLVHAGHHTVTLEKFAQDFFDGSWDTKSFGRCTDFNLMLKKGYSGDLKCVALHDKVSFTNTMTTGFYILQNNIKINANNTGQSLIKTLNKGDFIIFNEFGKDNVYNYDITFEIEENPEFENSNLGKIVAIKIDVCRI